MAPLYLACFYAPAALAAVQISVFASSWTMFCGMMSCPRTKTERLPGELNATSDALPDNVVYLYPHGDRKYAPGQRRGKGSGKAYSA